MKLHSLSGKAIMVEIALCSGINLIFFIFLSIALGMVFHLVNTSINKSLLSFFDNRTSIRVEGALTVKVDSK